MAERPGPVPRRSAGRIVAMICAAGGTVAALATATVQVVRLITGS
jgi:hypothetical protein